MEAVFKNTHTNYFEMAIKKVSKTKLMEMLEMGIPQHKICKMLGVNRQFVYKFHKKTFPGEKYDKKKFQQFSKLHESGSFSDTEIAYFLHMRKESVQRFKRDYNEQ